MRRTAMLIATLATTFSLAACSSDDPENGSGNAPPTEPSTESSAVETTSGGASGSGLAAPDRPVPTDGYADAKGACTSVSPEQVAKILGAEGEATGSGSKCTIEVAADKEITVEVSTLSSQGYSGVDDYESTHGTSAASKAVDGLGDAAYVSTVLGDLTMIVGDQFVEVDVVLDSKSQLADPTRDWSAEHEAAIAIAATVADRAPIPTS